MKKKPKAKSVRIPKVKKPVYDQKKYLAIVEDYGGTAVNAYNGLLVEVGEFLPDFNMFETKFLHDVEVAGKMMHFAQDSLYAMGSELRPVNEVTKKYIESKVQRTFKFYPEDVYNLRDLLGLIGINVKADSVATWTTEQRKRINAYAAAIHAVANDHRAVKVPPKPKELP